MRETGTLLLSLIGSQELNAFFYVYVQGDGRSGFTYLSPTVERYVGSTPEECLGDPERVFSAIAHPWSDVFREILANPSAEDILRDCLAIQWVEGSWTEHRAMRTVDGDETYTCGVFQNVSQGFTSLQWANRFATMTQRANTMIETISDPFVLFDPEGRLLSANSAAEREILGPTVDANPEEALRDWSLNNLPEVETVQWQSVIHAVFRDGKPHDGKIFRKRKIFCVRAYPVLDETGGVVSVSLFARDITEEQERKRRLRAFSVAVEQAAEGIMLTAPDGAILQVNPAFERLTGLGESEILSQPYNRLFPDGVPEKLKGPIPGTAPWSGRLRARGMSDKPIVVDLTVSPVSDQDGKICMAVWIWRDVTERVDLDTRMNRAQRLEALGVLAGGIAHDFNNILGGIIAYTEIAASKLGNARASSSLHQCLGEILQAGLRGREIVKQILSFARQAEDEPMPMNPSALAKETLKLIRAATPTTIKIVQKISTDAGFVRADPTQIHQVMVNLCTNAVQAMSGSAGILRLAIAPIEEEGRRWVGLTVSDTGTGIPESDRARIFDPFFTTKKGGTGLGLAVVYGIVEECGGKIHVESEHEEGTTFRVLLPRIEHHEERSRATESVDSYTGTPWARVLVVDDEASVAGGMQRILESLGHEVSMHTDSVEAFDVFRVDPDRFDLLVTDLTMSGLTGIDLAREIFKIRRIPVIVCTGYSDVQTMAAIKAAGVEEVLHKPVLSRDLAATIGRVLGVGERNAA
jgi:PAS domain S-box-containing protein